MNPLTEYEEQFLLQQAAAGNEQAFAALFHRYKLKLYGFLFRLTEDSNLTEDLVQDIFMKLWQRRDLLQGIETLGPYLFRMAQNHALNAFRKVARETLVSNTELPDTPVRSVDTILALKELEQLHQQLIRQLPPQQQTVYRLSREEGLSYADIGEQLGISAGTVKNHMIQALKTIRAGIRQHAPAGIGLLWLLLK